MPIILWVFIMGWEHIIRTYIIVLKNDLKISKWLTMLCKIKLWVSKLSNILMMGWFWWWADTLSPFMPIILWVFITGWEHIIRTYTIVFKNDLKISKWLIMLCDIKLRVSKLSNILMMGWGRVVGEGRVQGGGWGYGAEWWVGVGWRVGKCWGKLGR